jgi:hypothetical protein
MRLADALVTVPQFVPGKYEDFQQHLSPEWVEDALAATGTATIRRRRLPAEQTVWLLIGMAMMRNESVERVAARFNIALPDKSGSLAAPSGLIQARQRLGADPVEYLFTRSAEVWAHRSADEHRWRGLALYAMDGTTLRVADSPESWTEFGGSTGNGKRAGSAYPTVRVVALMAVRSHLLAALRFAAYDVGEVTLARELWPELPPDSLILVDRNFLLGADLSRLASDGTNRHWMTRAKSTTKLRIVKRYGKNDALVEIVFADSTRRANKELPAQWLVRAITYQRKGFKRATLLTSLTDPLKYPPDEVIELYHERWEIELGYDELKTHMLAREEALRSRTPAAVRQELWGIALAYNLVRLEMERVANEAGIAPTRISFVNALSMICHSWMVWSMPPLAPGRIPSWTVDLSRQLRMLLLPERRPERSYPRVVKIKMSNYDKKWVKRPPRN